MNVKDAMTTDLKSIGPRNPIVDAAQMMKSHDIGILPVLEGGKVLGTLTDRDIIVRGVAHGHDPKSLPVKEVMTSGCVCCKENDSLEDAMQLMRTKKLQRILVQDDDENIVGMISLADLSDHSSDRELVGKTLEDVKKS